jgi:flavin-dependent dehydrogenase
MATRTRPEYDGVVVGARAAGASTAMLLARRGLRVLAVDRDGYGSDTLSTRPSRRRPWWTAWPRSTTGSRIGR